MMMRKGDDDSFGGLEDFATKGQPLKDQLLYLAQDIALEAYFQNANAYGDETKTEYEEIDPDELAIIYSTVHIRHHHRID
jgi:hypothetical protein